MTNSEISALSLADYLDLIEATAAYHGNGKTSSEVNYDFYSVHGVVSLERFNEAEAALVELV